MYNFIAKSTVSKDMHLRTEHGAISHHQPILLLFSGYFMIFCDIVLSTRFVFGLLSSSLMGFVFP